MPRASSDWRVGCMSESAAPSSDTAGAPGCGVRRAATRQRHARRAHAPRRATAPQGQRRGAEPRSRAAPERRAAPRRTAAASHAPHVTPIVRVRPSPWYAASALSAKHTSFLPWLRTPFHRGRFLRSKVRSQETPQRLHFCRRIRRARGSTLLQPAASGRLSCRVFGRCGKHRLMAPCS